ncbi:DUF4032 domain-containing protein [Endomicrobium proavitum]|uniref:Putative ParB domain protein nuclease n=1 Tax=Endomicrobium proavitum TaxID=1408281 RepID=A0A0G3WJP5_9BACT|nr:DUF4032 domain-containing protein [Endomicrobium proavitum]AKL97719.1 putative ParB domain protein nuclease [Endomicrobium proavitum]
MRKNKKSVLVDFSSIEKNLEKLKIKNRGVSPIETDKIVGSLSRYNDFSENLIPNRDGDGLRYSNIKNGMLNGINFPPIQVYKVLDSYFIIDGHHRLMAATELFNAKYIDAEVLEVQFEFDISANKKYSYNTESAKKFLIKLEEHSFVEKTYMSNDILIHPLKVTEFGSYARLYSEIEDYKKNCSECELHRKPVIFASFGWYEKRFLPALEVMKKENVLAGFPHRTYTDLYVWISNHKYFLSQKAGYDVGFDFTAHDFFTKYKKAGFISMAPSKIKNFFKFIKKLAGKK